MKKLLKICLIVVAALAAAGVILVCVASVNVSREPSLDELNQSEWMRSHGWHISKRGPFCWRVTQYMEIPAQMKIQCRQILVNSMSITAVM